MSSFETEKIDSPIVSKFYWPSKEDLFKKMSFQKIDIYSNHYIVEFDKTQQFSQWHMRFISKKDIEKYKETPTLIEDEVNADSREIIREVFGCNRKEITNKLGSSFHTGLTMFTIGKNKDLKDNYIFEEHANIALCCELKNAEVDFSGLVPLEGCRKQLLRFLNSNLKNILFKKDYFEFGRLKKYYNLKIKSNLPQHRIEIYHGFKTVFEHYEGGIKVLIDTSCRILRTETLWEEFLNKRIDPRDKDKIRDFFIGMNCVVTYGNNKRYRIDDVEFKINVESEFPDKKYKNFIDYYQEKYKQTIRHRNQFLLLSKTKFIKYTKDNQREVIENEVHLIPELLQATGLTDEMKSDFRIMKDVGRETIMFPDQRFRKIENMAKEISDFKEAGFQMKINSKSNKIMGYKIPKPVIKTNTTYQLNQDRIQIKDVYKGKTIKNWVLFYDYRSRNDVKIVTENLSRCSSRYNIKYQMPLESIEIPKNARVKDLDKLIRSKKVKLIFFFITKFTAKYFYQEVKKYYQKNGIATQFFTSFRYDKDRGNLSKFSNILTQMIVKYGGTLWSVRSNIKKTIIQGVNLSKVKKGPNNFEDMACIVSQMGDNFNKQYSVANFKDSANENCNQLIARSMLQPALQYKKKFKSEPKRMVIYRNIANERELNGIIGDEINGLIELLKKEFENPPKLCILMVTKKINDRFVIPTNRGLNNPEGVVIMDDVVKPGIFNFFLVAQRVNQGTATPTHYQTIYNDTDLNSEEIVKLTYDQCYNYMNWMGPVRVPSSLQYSEKMGAQLSLTREDKISSSLKKKFFFL